MSAGMSGLLNIYAKLIERSQTRSQPIGHWMAVRHNIISLVRFYTTNATLNSMETMEQRQIELMEREMNAAFVNGTPEMPDCFEHRSMTGRYTEQCDEHHDHRKFPRSYAAWRKMNLSGYNARVATVQAVDATLKENAEVLLADFRYLSSKSFNLPLFYGLFTIHSSKSFNLPLFLGRFLPVFLD